VERDDCKETDKGPSFDAWGDKKLEFYDVIRTRRSIREFRPDPVPEDVLRRILEAARVAPSGSNRQPWRLILVKDKMEKERIVPLAGGQRFVAEAPILIVACGQDIKYNRGGYMGELSMLVDVAIAVDHLTLAARAEGLGTCWIGSFDNTHIKELLKIPHDFNVVALVPLGYPKGGFSETGPRKKLEEIVCEGYFK
jgi:nitroreductase